MKRSSCKTATTSRLQVGGKENADAVWYYPEAKYTAKEIENYVAFWRGVEVKE
jgi:uncharacterized protein (DUF427 family)